MAEKRLIDAKPLMENGWHLVKTGESNRFLTSMSLADVPTVDAVEVVHCDECKHYDEDDDFCCYWHGCRYPDHYCGEGERRTDGICKKD